MKLSEAIAFVRAVRPSWQADAKGAATARINSNHVLEILGDVELDSITPMSYVNIQECCKAEGRTPATTNRITSALSTIFTELKKHSMVTDVVRCPNTLKESKGRVTYYSEDEVQRMLTASLQLPNIDKQEVHDVVLMAAKTGARQGELLKLKWTDVYFDEGVVVFRDTKTDEDRELPLTTSVREMLEKRYASRIDDGEVFLIGKDSLLRRLRAVQKAAGIDGKDKCFHTLRHTAATTMFAKGASLPEVQAVLGHSQASTTLRYSHATQEGKRKALNYLD